MKIKDFDFFNEFGLNDLEDVDKNAIDSMKASNWIESFFETRKGAAHAEDYYVFAALYTQNYLLLKQLLQINMKNKELIIKNDKLVEQNEELKQQNNQIIELLQKIADK
ncbi:MAG: hypothetical protein K2P09_02830 [Erysipelotrichales bacterium]|nr:hypothetical protein [Erysipelotrichales bacterium]